jgi:hypothetical protein
MGNGGITPTFITLTLDRGEWSASWPCHFTPRQMASGNDYVGGWLGLRVSLGTVEVKGKVVSVLN